MQYERAATPEATRVIIRILVGIVQGTIRQKGDVFHYANTSGVQDHLDASVIRSVMWCFNKGIASPGTAAYAIAGRGLQDLTADERELVFRTIVLDVPGFLTWCFPLLTGFSLIARERGFIDGRESARLWVNERLPRWLITHVLLHRHRDPHEPRIDMTDFSPDQPLTGIAATLEEFGVLDAWLDDAAMKTDAEALYRESARRTAPFVRPKYRAAWMLGGIDRPGAPSARHRLVLRGTEATHLWGSVRANTLVAQTGRIEHARARLGAAFVQELAETGYLEAVGDDDAVTLNRDKLRRTTIILAEACGWKPPMPRVQDLPPENVRRYDRPWIEVIERAGVSAAKLARLQQRAVIHPPTKAPRKVAGPARNDPSVPTTSPRIPAPVDLTTEIHLTPNEAVSLLRAAERTAAGERVDAAMIGARLAQHLVASGYLQDTPSAAGLRFNDQRFNQSVPSVCDVDIVGFTNRFQPPPPDGKTDKSWVVRLRRSVSRATTRQSAPLPEMRTITATHRFRIRADEAASILRLAERSPFDGRDIVACLAPEFREVLRACGYLNTYGVWPFAFQTTIFEAVPSDVVLMDDCRHEAIPEAEQRVVPVMCWLDDLRAIARGAQ